MKIKPYYPKNILKIPYYKGIKTGLFLGVGSAILITYNLVWGAIILAIGTLLYTIEQSDDYNFINPKDLNK